MLIRAKKSGPKHKANVFRLLTFILYGAGYGMIQHGGYLVELMDFNLMYLPTGMDSRSIRPALQELERLGYISDLALERNHATFFVKEPRISKV